MNEAARRTVAIAKSQRMISRGKRRRGKRIPRALPPTLIAKEYGAALAALVSRTVLREAFATMLRELPDLLARARAERGDGRTDAGEGPYLRRLVAEAKARLRTSAVSTAEIEALAQKFAERTSTHQRIQLNKQTKAAIGVDVFTSDKGLPAKIAGFITENVSLIHDITDTIANRVEKHVTRALTSATLHGDLAKTLDEEFGYGEKRAKLIARDQIGKIYGQITASRHRQLGVSRFVWNTVGDERVRGDPGGKYPDADSSHYDWDGKIFAYDDPPRDEDGVPVLPGEPILCRCFATPVLDDILDAVDEE